MRLRAALPIVTGLLLVGCYNYLPLRRSSLVPSSYLAVTLTESGSEELARYLGPNPFVVRGRYLSATERGLGTSVETGGQPRREPGHRPGGALGAPQLPRAPCAAPPI